MSIRGLLLWILGAFVVAAPGCASSNDEPGDETHFQACRADGDCTDPGRTTCERGYCRTPPEGAGGRSADASPSSGAACDDGTHTFCTDGVGGFAGSIGYVDCHNYINSGLKAVDCPSADGNAAKAVLVSWCEHVASVQDGFPAQAVAKCGAPLVTGSFPGELDVDAVCAPSLPDVLRSCADTLRPCERLPLCVAGGVYGCDQIRQECSALSPVACRSGFDSRTFAGRTEIHDCLTSAPPTEDCVATFYRCVWGL